MAARQPAEGGSDKASAGRGGSRTDRMGPEDPIHRREQTTMTDLSFQLYTARNYPPLSDVLALLGSLGYRQVEGVGGVYGTMDADAAHQLKSELDQNGLTMPTGHFAIDLIENEPKKVMDFASALGVRAIYAPYITPEMRPGDAEGWKALGKRLEDASKPFRDAGYEFGWHNHDFEFQALPDGSFPHDLLFEAAPSLSWEMDVAWVVRGGADPFKWIDLYKHRISAVHVKDIAREGENRDEDGWADVGYGVVDWKALIPVLKSTSARHFIIEHDNPSDLARFARRSIENVKALQG